MSVSKDEIKTLAEKLVKEKPGLRNTYGNLNIDKAVDLTYAGYNFILNEKPPSFWKIIKVNYKQIKEYAHIEGLDFKGPGLIVFVNNNRIITILSGGLKKTKVRKKLIQEVRHNGKSGRTLQRKILEKDAIADAAAIIHSCQYIVLAPTNSASASDIGLTKKLLTSLVEPEYPLSTTCAETLDCIRKMKQKQ